MASRVHQIQAGIILKTFFKNSIDEPRSLSDHSSPMKRKTKNPLIGHNGQLMVMAAHRYCLGRRTYIVGACCEWLRANWGEFESNTKNIILRDTIYELMDGEAGDNCDTANWTSFARFGFEEINEDGKQWVRDAVAWKGMEWPL